MVTVKTHQNAIYIGEQTKILLAPNEFRPGTNLTDALTK